MDKLPIINSLQELISEDDRIGSVVSMDYDKATIATTDFHQDKVGGIPRKGFLIAVAQSVEEIPSEVVLLSVDAPHSFNSEREFQVVREQLAMDSNVDGSDKIDSRTQARLERLGFSCSVMGTFYKDTNGMVKFGADIDRIRGNSLFQVYRPQGRALSLIGSYGNSINEAYAEGSLLDVGTVRYSETQIKADLDSKVYINVKDFVGKKSAVFGMTRTGKALTPYVKIPVPKSKMFPEGFAFHKDLSVGDSVYSSVGRPVKIVATTEWAKEPIWLIKFSDGSTVEASAGHLWSVRDAFAGKEDVHDASTSERKIILENTRELDKLAHRFESTEYSSLEDVAALSESFTVEDLEQYATASGIKEHLSHKLPFSFMKLPFKASKPQRLYPVAELLSYIASEKRARAIEKGALERVVSTKQMLDLGLENDGVKRWSVRRRYMPHAGLKRKLQIVSIEQQEETFARCLTVDSTDSLFLVEDYIPTHNSNSIKTILQKVHMYGRKIGKPIAQLVFDPQGEYANTNSQDGSALAEIGDASEVAIYKILDEILSPKEKHLQFDLFADSNLSLTWELGLIELANSISKDANYIAPLHSVTFEKTEKADVRSRIHYNRKKLMLFGLMSLANFNQPIQPFSVSVGVDNVEWILEKADRSKLRESSDSRGELIVTSLRDSLVLAKLLSSSRAKLSDSWNNDFEEGDVAALWDQIDAIEEKGRNGVKASLQRLKPLHNSQASGDVRDNVWEDIKLGKLIVVDLSKGATKTSQNIAELIVNHLVKEASNRFTQGLDPVPFQIVVEEAHNLFERNGNRDDFDPWVRLSKEASKYHIGLLYATQEITSVDPRILSNTSNWIVAHLNSTTETRELSKYYGFEDWQQHLIRAEAKGFVRLKTESSPYIVPVQIDRFVAERGRSEIPTASKPKLKASKKPSAQVSTNDESDSSLGSFDSLEF